VILDTHVWWRDLTGTGRMPKATRRRIEQARAAGRLQVAAVTLWEIALLVQEGKLRLDDAVPKWLHTALARSGTTVAALEPEAAHDAARAAATLSDPAGCQIVGTAVYLRVPLATRDGRLIECGRRLGIEVLEA
jgi:PIN domain nuclease of toxin-antitoxin system